VRVGADMEQSLQKETEIGVENAFKMNHLPDVVVIRASTTLAKLIEIYFRG
jgi:hypothetical protein